MKNTLLLLLLLLLLTGVYTVNAQIYAPEIKVQVMPDNNIGIKTEHPSGDIHIKDARANLYIQNTDPSNWSYLKIQGSGTNSWDIGQYGNNDYLEFRPKGGSSNRIKIYQNGTLSATTYLAISPPWADFVFHENYNLPTLPEVEHHIKEKGHLKDIPSAKEVKKNGINLGEMDSKLLQKIEELTLYTIEQEKKITKLESLNEKLLELQNRLEKLEKIN